VYVEILINQNLNRTPVGSVSGGTRGVDFSAALGLRSQVMFVRGHHVHHHHFLAGAGPVELRN
jgi:hypothetical protein